jgi:transposase
MSKTYRPWEPTQSWLLPPSPQDWLDEGDLVYFLLDTVMELDLSAITSKYEQEGRGYPPYHPRMMVTLLLYAYCRGIFSSRRMQQACEERVTFRVIVGHDIPNFRTISDFRKLHLQELQGLFVQVLRLCQEAGLVKLGHVSLDGTKIKANASRHKAMSYQRMKQEEKRLQQEIRELLQQAESVDADEDQRYGPDRRGDELPEELSRRETRLKRIRQAKRALEAKAKAAAQAEQRRRMQQEEDQGAKPRRGRNAQPVSDKPDDKKQYNFTDPESGIMKANNKGWDQCGNAQAVVDEEKQVIVACDVTDAPNDKQQAKPLMSQAQTNVGEDESIDKASMDSGYFSEANIGWLEEHGIDGYVATGRIKHGERVPAAPRGRPPDDLTVKEKMARKLRTKKGRQTYAKRKSIVEPVFGQIKRARGFVQFSLRGLAKMRGEWAMVCLTHNLLKLFGAQPTALG